MTPAIVYYVSNSHPYANDNNAGTNSERPWKSLAKASSMVYNPGDSLLLKCGDVWRGEELVLRGNGTDSEWIMLSSYGAGERPVITDPPLDTDLELSVGQNQEPDPRTGIRIAVKIKNVAGWKIVGLRVTDAEQGIVCVSTDAATEGGFWFENCSLENINNGRLWQQSDKEHPFFVKSSAVHVGRRGGYFTNITVKDCEILDASRALALHNIRGLTIDNVFTDDIHTEGFQIVDVEGGTMQNCTMTRTGYPTGVWHGVAAVMFGWMNRSGETDFVVRDCDFADVRDPGTNDGMAVDWEAGNRNTAVTNCLIRDCDSSALMFFDNGHGRYNENNMVENCVVMNCGRNGYETIPAFIRHYLDQSGRITGNKIQRAVPNQKINSVQENFIKNPSFEDGESHWSLSGANAAIVAKEAAVGTHSLELRPGGSASQVIPVKETTDYAVAFWAKHEGENEAGRVKVQFLDERGSTLGEHNIVIPAGSDSRETGSPFTTPAGARSVKLIIAKESGESALYVDCVRLRTSFPPDVHGWPDDSKILSDGFAEGFKWSGNIIYEPGQEIPFTPPPAAKQKNIAPEAEVTASSSKVGCEAEKAVDGIIGENDRGEWVSDGETKPWIELRWKRTRVIDRVRLCDRKTLASWTQSGRLVFSDGSSLAVIGGLRNDGAMREVVFTPKKTAWIRFEVTRSQGTDIGLSEIQVYRARK